MDLKIEITVKEEFIEECMQSSVESDENGRGSILNFMSAMILRVECHRYKGETIKVHSNDLLGEKPEAKTAFCKAAALMASIAKDRDKEGPSETTLKDIMDNSED